jgi:glycosyltransferase involved in cell wall biosynthesis
MKQTHSETIFLYDFLLVKGGAESLGITLVNGLENCDFCVAFSNHDIFSELERKQLNLKELISYTAITGWQSIKTIWAFQNKTQFLFDYQQVIYSGIYAPVAVKHHPQGKNILYCHTPPRFVYDLKEYYLQQACWWQKPLLGMLTTYVQYHYEKALAQMDIVVVNSENVKRRMKHYLACDAIVINPPIAVDDFVWIEQQDYYLSLARVESYKRVALIVRAFKELPHKKLIVASGGSDLEKLKVLAEGYSNIHFTGWCSPEQLQKLIGSCLATIYIPHDEDFGMSPVESMAAGKPVIGVAEGGLLETILDGETGLLLDKNLTEKQLIEAINFMTGEKALSMRITCEARAQLYRSEQFIQKMKKVLS